MGRQENAVLSRKDTSEFIKKQEIILKLIKFSQRNSKTQLIKRFPEFQRGKVGFCFEKAAERLRMLKSKLIGNFGNGGIGR